MTRKGFEKISGRTRVVGNWQPSNLNQWTLGEEFSAELRKIFGEFTGHNLTVRSPDYHRLINLNWKLVLDWHVDEPSGGFYVLWSNVLPTEVRSRLTNRRLKVSDGDIILLNNRLSAHRVPARFREVYRWFIRMEIKGLD